MNRDPEKASMLLLVFMTIIILVLGGGFFYYLSIKSAAEKTTTQNSIQTKNEHIVVYYVKLDDGGKSGKLIGCNDSLVAVEKTTTSSDLLKTAIKNLLADHSQNESANNLNNSGSLYNALYLSSLDLENIIYEENKIIVRLSGNLKMGGECDNPRVKAQIEETVRQYAGGKEIEILINNNSLDSLLSLK